MRGDPDLDMSIDPQPLNMKPRCVCDIDDGLVREWVAKARAVAQSKGYKITVLTRCARCGKEIRFNPSRWGNWEDRETHYSCASGRARSKPHTPDSLGADAREPNPAQDAANMIAGLLANNAELRALVMEASEIMNITYAGNFPAGIESFLIRAASAVEPQK